MDTSLITFGVVAFAILLGYAALVWFIWNDDRRMEREEHEAFLEEIDGLYFKKSA